MHNRVVRTAALAALALGAACASGGGGGAAESASAGPRFERNRIGPEELGQAASRNLTTVYAVIQATRPQWLRTGSSGFGGGAATLAVFEDNNRLGGIEVLRSYPLGNVDQIRYLTPSEAGARFGLDVNNGAIQIVTRTGR